MRMSLIIELVEEYQPANGWLNRAYLGLKGLTTQEADLACMMAYIKEKWYQLDTKPLNKVQRANKQEGIHKMNDRIALILYEDPVALQSYYYWSEQYL